uniref:Uncharacterized protein n=1 Tax=Arundo donax TaxID=35708 RepID=A0A0A9GZ46_ARUDO
MACLPCPCIPVALIIAVHRTKSLHFVPSNILRAYFKLPHPEYMSTRELIMGPSIGNFLLIRKP